MLAACACTISSCAATTNSGMVTDTYSQPQLTDRGDGPVDPVETEGTDSTVKSESTETTDNVLTSEISDGTEAPEKNTADSGETDKSDKEKEDEILDSIRKAKAGTSVDTSSFSRDLIDRLFYSEKISDKIVERITGISYKKNDNISLSDLRYIRVLHTGFDGMTHIGELIVNRAIADDVVAIMRELYENEYPIEKMVLVDEYGGDDEASMSDNNTSAFNYRVIANTSTLSNHALGMAIDINPRYNPYVTTNSAGKTNISPGNGAEYADRDRDFMAKIDHDDLCYRLFLSHGFSWGGDWKKNKDYQHFEKKSR